MGFIKKLLMTVWYLATLIGVCALMATIYGPWTHEALALFAVDTYSYAVQGCIAVSLIGGLIMWIRVLSRRKKANSISLEEEDGSQITITRDAISSQARYIVEEDGSCEATKVGVFAEKKGLISVQVTIRPHYTVSAVEKGAELRQELQEGLTKLCGDRIEGISLEFLAPEEASAIESDDGASSYLALMDADAEDGEPEGEEAEGAEEPQEAEATAEETPHKEAPEGSAHPDPSGDGVTIPMRGVAAHEEGQHE